jgi:hypothetical protein
VFCAWDAGEGVDVDFIVTAVDPGMFVSCECKMKTIFFAIV